MMMGQGDKSHNNPGPPPPPTYKVWNNGGNFIMGSNPRSRDDIPAHLNLNPSSTSFKGVMPRGGVTFLASKQSRPNWKARKAEKRKEQRRNNNNNKGNEAQGTLQGRPYEPPRLHELQAQNRLKARRFYAKKKQHRVAPYAPRNTTSFIIRAKKSGGIASLVSPCPVTPAILPTPVISPAPASEGLIDMAKEEWGVNGYGSMKGLIRLRDNGFEVDARGDEDCSSESDVDENVEEHVEMERRLDHDLSRFEMIYPYMSSPMFDGSNPLETRVIDQESQLARLEEENLTLKERLFLMEQEMQDLRRRLQHLECGAANPNNNTNNNNCVNSNTNCNAMDNGVSDEDAAEVCSEKSVGDGDGQGDRDGAAEVCSEKSVGDGEAQGDRDGDGDGDAPGAGH